MPARAVFVLVVLLAVALPRSAPAHPNHQLDLVATRPAVDLAEDAYPVGNGFMGALISGGIASDLLVLSEHSLWEDLRLGAPPSEQDLTAWRPQTALAALRVETGHVAERARTFLRRLDLQTGTVEVTYRHDRVRHQREYFCSKPDRVLAARFRANRRGEINLVLSLDADHELESRFDEENNRLICRGALPENGLAFGVGVELRCRGGAIRHEGGRLLVEAADEVTLLVAAATAFGPPEAEPLAALLGALRAKDLLTVRQAHLTDYQALFHSMYITIEGPSQTSWTTAKRLEAYRNDPAQDPGLEELLFQYARYLMIASSRAESLPAHRRGRWVFPPRGGVDNAYGPDWKLAYAGVKPTQLGDCAQPMKSWAAAPVPAENGATAFQAMRQAALRGEGRGAHTFLRRALRENSLPNLLPRDLDIGDRLLLIDGLGLMLARVDDDVLRLFPALPEAWPDGSFVGLRPGKGAPLYEVAAAWQEGALLEAYLTHLEGGKARLALDSGAYEVVRDEVPVPFDEENGIVSFVMERDEMVSIRRRD